MLAEISDAVYLRVFAEGLRVHVGRRVLEDCHCVFRVHQVLREGEPDLSVS